jgi:thiol-disulfide isomerase/thioredoxin
MENYIEINEIENKFVICFYDDLIGPCGLIKPLYSQFSEEFPEVSFYFVDAKENKELIETFEINCFPTFVTFHKSEIFERWAGAN